MSSNLEETTKLEKLFAQHGCLRLHIPNLLQHRVFYSRLKQLKDNWKVFKDVLEGIGILVGDILLIYDLIKVVPENEVEVQIIKKKKCKGDNGKYFCFNLYF